MYRSFPDVDAAKAWMDLNQLGRRNLSKEKRDAMIKRLAAAGVRQKDIAEKVGLSRPRVANIVASGNVQNEHEPTVNTVSPSAEIESLQRKLEEAEAARRSTEQRLSAVQSDLKTAKMVIETAPKNVERDKEFLRNKLKEEQERHEAGLLPRVTLQKWRVGKRGTHVVSTLASFGCRQGGVVTLSLRRNIVNGDENGESVEVTGRT